MKISRTTLLCLSLDSYLSCLTTENTANLYLHGQGESVIIQFIPENLPTLKALVAALEEIDAKLHQAKLENLQQQINAIQHSNGKLTTVATSELF